MSVSNAKAIRIITSVALLVGLTFTAPTPRAYAAAINVTTTNPNVNIGDGQCSLIEAINEANTTGGSGGDCTAGSAGADTIELGAGATYTLTGVDNSYADKGDNGLPVIVSTITINGHGATINRPLSGAPAFRFFFVEVSAALALNQLTLVRGVDSGANNNFFGGGGIHNLGTLSLNDSSVTGSYSYYGGGIWSSGVVTVTNSFFSNSAYSEVSSCGGSILNEAGTLTISGSTFSNNLAGSAGGGICNRAGGIVTIANSTFSDNGTPYRVLNGAAISNAGTLIITNSTISGNNAYTGGGIFNGDGSILTITNSNISDNTALGDGGGIYNFGINEASTLSVSDSTFSNNVAGVSNGSGGGIYNMSMGPLTITRTNFSGNSAELGAGIYQRGVSNVPTHITASTFSNNDRGGLYNFFGPLVVDSSTFSNNMGVAAIESRHFAFPPTVMNGLTITNSTFSNNPEGGVESLNPGVGLSAIEVKNSTFFNNGDSGISNIAYSGGSATTTLYNTIIANNISARNCSATIIDGGNNLQFGGDPFWGDSTCGATIPVADPLLGSLQNNGGLTKTHALLPGSPAIDAGNDSVCAADPVNSLDQRGVARPQGAACDIGAYEFIQPALNFPQSGNAPSTTRPLFDWDNVGIATSYTLQTSTNQNFTSLVLNTNLTPSAYVMPTDLPRNTLLFWRVRANGPGGPSAWSRVRHFYSANPPGVPSLLAPANGATVANGQPTLDWSDVTPVTSYYEVQISTDPNFATILGRGQGGRVNVSTYTPEVALSSGTPYFWRVRAVSGGADGGMQFSQWSAVRSFNTPP
ncbi:MAG: hypothetical protein HYZ49_09170 [Chloroflexi bacterium]|nr:hypothetical protein [Chloroflexota bacterium]